MRTGRGPGLARLIGDGVVAGVVGTAVMSTTARARRELHARRRGVAVADIEGILDYDDSEHVVTAAGAVLGTVLGWRPRTAGERRAVFWLVHWGYGSVVGVGHAGLHRLLGREPHAGLAFFGACQAMALGLFPVLGGTPVPWRWRRDLLVTSVVQHGIYAGSVAGAHALQRAR